MAKQSPLRRLVTAIKKGDAKLVPVSENPKARTSCSTASFVKCADSS